MTFNDRSFAYAQASYLLLIALLALIFPAVGFFTTLSAMTAVWVVTVISYQTSSARNSIGWWALLALTAAMMVAVVITMHCHPSGNIWIYASNMALTSGTAIACASLACRLYNPADTPAAAIHNRALIITAATLPLASAAITTSLYPALYLGMALAGYGITALSKPQLTRKENIKLWSAFAIGTAIVSVTDPRICIAIAIGISAMLPWKKGHEYRRAGIMTAIVATAWIAANISGTQAQDLAESLTTAAIPHWKQLVQLPIDVMKLFLSPYPWILPWGPASVTWYATGALIIYFCLSAWPRSTGGLKRLSAVSVTLWIATALFCSGDEAWRQALSFLPWMTPGATTAIGAIRQNPRKFTIFAIIFSLAIITALLILYHFRNRL